MGRHDAVGNSGGIVMQLDDATLAQVDAADPSSSTWLSANAGSGKTRVLTDRVARLLFDGTDPQKVLCLTYTKAAASEMQNRLFKRLGSWAMLDDAALTETLSALGIANATDLDKARTLFARAIDTPGGLKIQTIHSFCSALLRQFPLEAGITPNFTEIDESMQSELIEVALDRLAESGSSAFSELALLHSSDSVVNLCRDIVRNQESFARTSKSNVFAEFNLEPEFDENAFVSDCLSVEDLQFCKSMALSLEAGKSEDIKASAAFKALPDTPNAGTLETLGRLFVYDSSTKSPGLPKTNRLPSSALKKGALAEVTPKLHELMERIAEAFPTFQAARIASKTWVLRHFAQEFLPLYQHEKAQRGYLDFDDLILKTRDLLSDESFAWVLYRLDGGIDHILVDEAQDTSPAQWQVIDALCAEMASGKGARDDVERTLFVVGDKKQSIYSFQGADARMFNAMNDKFRSQMGGEALRDRGLRYSFRSSPAILKAVDAVFEENAGLDDDLDHRAYHSALPGRVDLWDIVEPPEKPEEDDWFAPVDRPSENSTQNILAHDIAAKVGDLLKTGSIPADSGGFRRIQPEDILILVQSRGALFNSIIRECKAIDIPIAGADRLKINAELAVRDLLALLSVVSLPEDDLSLATVLRSPLFGWSEQDLYDLAHQREGYLWAELRRRKNEFPSAYDEIEELRRRADFLRPYEMLEFILGSMRGRQKLTARLGAEAEDGIDELLNQAVSYERTQVPSLTGFVTKISSEIIDIKRETDSSGHLVRVMTVHGAKGLEAPIVILPHTVRVGRPGHASFVLNRNGSPIWNAAGKFAPQIVQDAQEDAAAAQSQEDERLLYVAMTRAAYWFIGAGAGYTRMPKTNWHQKIESGLKRAGAGTVTENERAFLRLSFGEWEEAKDTQISKEETVSRVFAEIPSGAPANLPAKPTLLSPSDLGGAKALASSDVIPQDGRAFGTTLHKLLEVLPACEREKWPAIVEKVAGLEADDPKEASRLLRAVSDVVDFAPDVFVPDALAEVDVFAHAPSLKSGLFGSVDRLIIRDDIIHCIDFKSNSIIPKHANDVPEGILRQMGAYLEALEAIWPDMPIKLEIIWTSGPERMVLEHGIVRNALAMATTS
ncbi:MAG: double-strand break repair helicase AddA [Boseongicola sp.]|nr:double-strand break repair helicase AddA [Boseongicola sp.]